LGTVIAIPSCGFAILVVVAHGFESSASPIGDVPSVHYGYGGYGSQLTFAAGTPFRVNDVRFSTRNGRLCFFVACTGNADDAVQLAILLGPQTTPDTQTTLDTMIRGEGTIGSGLNEFGLTAAMPVEYTFDKGELYAFLIPYDATTGNQDLQGDVVAASNIYHGTYAR
jgi:hypothetical protein